MTDVIEYFSPGEAAEWIRQGRARWDNNRRMGVANRADSAKYARPENDDVGMIGEGLGARRWRKRLDTAIGEYKNIDLEILEIRARGPKTLGQLPIKRVDVEKMQLPFALIVVDVAKGIGRWRGWLTGWQAMERAEKVYYADQQTWYVPPPYWQINALDDWIFAGARPMWMPWDFDWRKPNTNRLNPFAEPEEL